MLEVGIGIALNLLMAVWALIGLWFTGKIRAAEQDEGPLLDADDQILPDEFAVAVPELARVALYGLVWLSGFVGLIYVLVVLMPWE